MAKTLELQAQSKAKAVARTLKPAHDAKPIGTKSARVTVLLQRAKGASIAEIMTATDWQPHSVRGFLSGTIVKRKGQTISSDKADGERRYRVIAAEDAP